MRLNVAMALKLQKRELKPCNTQSSKVPYDLIGKVAEGTKLTRKTAAAILSGISPQQFYKFRNHPEEFISKVVTTFCESDQTCKHFCF